MKEEKAFLGIRFRPSLSYAFAGVVLFSAFCGFGLWLLFESKDNSRSSVEINIRELVIEKPEKSGAGKPVLRLPARSTNKRLGLDDEDPAANIDDRAHGKRQNGFSVGNGTSRSTLHISRGTTEIDRERLPAWRRHAAKTPATGSRPKIAVVIDDLGIDRRNTARAIALRGPLTLSFLAYGLELKKQTASARKAGHELMVHVSMEPIDDDIDPGPQVLLTDLQAQEIRERLEWQLGRFGFFVGINNHMGSKFTADVSGMTVVMKELKSRGLLFLDSRTTSESVGLGLAQRFGVPSIQRSVFLDNVDDLAAVNAQLRAVEKIAMKEGVAVAIAHPRDITLGALEVWLNDLARRDFVLVPISAVVAPRNIIAIDERATEEGSAALRPVN